MGGKNLGNLTQMKNVAIRESITKHWWRTFVSDLIFQTWNNGGKLKKYDHQLRIQFVSNVTLEQLITHVNNVDSILNQ